MGYFWTPEQDDRIKECLHHGMSASQIGAELGVSRNAIIGRVGRNKELSQVGFARKSGWPGKRVEALKKRKSRAKPASELLRTPRPKPQPKRRVKVVSPSILFEPVPPKPLPEPRPQAIEAPEPLNLTLLDLTSHTCKWPVNEPAKGENGHLFCGHETETGKPWCAHHVRLAYGAGTRSEQIAPRVLQAAA